MCGTRRSAPRTGVLGTGPRPRTTGVARAVRTTRGQPRALRDEPFELFHCPMLSVMIFTEASAAWVACA